MQSLCLENLAATERLGNLIAEQLISQSVPQTDGGGIVLGLIGTLGAGKTNLAQSIVSYLGIPREQITSPTFSLIQSYAIQYPLTHRMEAEQWTIHHVDAYRIADDDEFLDLGVDELMSARNTLTIIEWAGKIRGCLPDQTLWIELEWQTNDRRGVVFSGFGGYWDHWIETLASRFNHV